MRSTESPQSDTPESITNINELVQKCLRTFKSLQLPKQVQSQTCINFISLVTVSPIFIILIILGVISYSICLALGITLFYLRMLYVLIITLNKAIRTPT